MNVEWMLYKRILMLLKCWLRTIEYVRGGGQHFRIRILHLDSYIYSDWNKWGWMMHECRMNVVLMQYECRMNVAEMLIENYWVCQGGGAAF